MKRRAFIKSTGLSTITALAGSSVFLKACHTEEDMIGEPNWIVDGSFDRRLPLPSLVTGNVELTAQITSAVVRKDSMTSVFSYRNGLLGDTIKATTGSTATVHLQNNLDEASNIHWHGLILPENMDGHPKDVIKPGEAFTYTLPIIQRAGTYWYHPHPHGATARQVFMGMAGLFIVNDAEEAALNLPSGEFEFPLIIQDKRLSGGSLDYSPSQDEIMTGYLGEDIAVNGICSPFKSISAAWYRMRVLNGSTARVLNLAFSNGMPFHIIGSDGGLLRTPESVTSILLGPGERADVLVDFRTLSGQQLYLVSNKFSKYDLQGRQGFRILKFVVDGSTSSAFTLPGNLSVVSAISSSASIHTRTFDIAAVIGGTGGHGGGGMHTIGGKTFEMERIDEVVQAGTTEIWEFDNRNGEEIHPMHIHGVQFQLLDRTGGRNTIIATEKAWKDTVLVMAGEKVRVIMTFPDYKGVFVFHCHNLEHEDDGMMLNYRID